LAVERSTWHTAELGEVGQSACPPGSPASPFPLFRTLSEHQRSLPSEAKSTLLTDAVEKGLENVAEQ